MENIVTSIETSRALAKAFFPNDSALAWEEVASEEFSSYLAPYIGGEYQLRCWTAQEIADQLPRMLENEYPGYLKVLAAFKPEHGWYAGYYPPSPYHGEAPIEAVNGDTMAEALAALWLKVKREANQ